MTNTDVIKISSTGGQVDDLVMALIDSANDREAGVRGIILSSLMELGKKQSSLVLTSCLAYLQRHNKLAQPHRVVILQVLEAIVKLSVADLDREVALEVIRQASNEMTRAKEVIPDWQGSASSVLVAMGTRFCNDVMDDLLQKFTPGVLPHFFVLETMANMASANVFGMLPFLKGTIGSMLPMMGLAKAENMRWVFSFALARFCEAILDYVANIEKAPDPSVRKEAFESEVNNAFEVLLNVWVNSKEAKLRVAVVDALGQMSLVMSQPRLQEHLPKLLQCLLGLYRKHTEPYHITQGLCMVLDAATVDGSPMLEPHFDQLLTVLYPQLCAVVDYTNPLTVKNHNEILRCFAALARPFSDRLVTLLLQKLENVNDRTRVGVLCALRHLVNSAGPHMEDKKALVVSGVKILLHDSTNKTRKVFAQLVLAMAHHGYLELEGGQAMIDFIVRQCALPPEPAGRRPTDPEFVSNDALRSMCDNVLQLLATTVDDMSKVLWPYLLEFLVSPDHSAAITALTQTIATVAGKKREDTAVDLEVAFDRYPNVPKPSAIFARLLVLSGQPSKSKNRGLACLLALRQLGPVLNEYLSSLWDNVIPKLCQHLEDKWASDEDWSQKVWEDLLLKFLSKTLNQISDEEWFANLADSLAHQMALYDGLSEEKNFLYKCLGLTLKSCGRKSVVSRYLDDIFTAVKHTSQTEREGCAIAAGFTASAHLDCVLTKLESLSKSDNKKSSGIFGFIKDTVSSRSDADDKLRATVMLSYGYVTMYAPHDLIVSRLEVVISRVILPAFDHAKDPHIRYNLILATELIAKAMHPDHLRHNHTFSLRTQLLYHMVNFVKTEKTTELTNRVRAEAMSAMAGLVKLDPVLSSQETSDVLTAACDSVLCLPPEGSAPRRHKVDTYAELLETQSLLDTTTAALGGLVSELGRKDLTPGNVGRLVKLLHPWLVSASDHERHRAVSLVLALLEVHREEADPVRAGSSFSSLGAIVGWLVPRCSDPSQDVRTLAVDCVYSVYRTQGVYDGKGLDHQDPLVEAIPSLKARLEKADSATMFSALSDLAKVVIKQTLPAQLMPLQTSLMEGLLDPQPHSSSGACVVLNGVLKARGGELHSQIPEICGSLLRALPSITAPQTHTGTLHCLRTITALHLMSSVDYLLGQPLPLDKSVSAVWGIFGQDDVLTASLLDHLLDALSRLLPYDEKPDPREKDATMRVATVQTMAITAALTELCRSEEITSAVLNHYPRLLVTMLQRIAATIGTRPPKVTKEEARDKQTVTLTREVPVDPCETSVLGCQQVLRAAHCDELLEALSEHDVWTKLADQDQYIDGFTLFARSLVSTQPQYVSKVTTILTPALTSMYEPLRVMAAAVFAELMASRCSGDTDQAEMLINSFLGRQVDSCLTVRMLCVRGLGNVASGGPELIQKFATTLLSAMMSGMDDKDDADDDVTLEAMEGLARILGQMDEEHIRSILINVALRIRPCFEKDKESVRAAAFTLFGCLTRFGDGPSKEPFLEQVHTNLVSLLLHLNDPDTGVIKACKSSLQRVGPLLGSPAVNDMFQKHLLEEGSLHYGEFVNQLSKQLIKDFPDKANFYAMAAVNFFRSNCTEIKSNAAMFTGFLLGNLPEEKYASISREHICSALVLLLKDASPDVRIKAAEAMSWMYNL